jgi:hypothetical protein
MKNLQWSANYQAADLELPALPSDGLQTAFVQPLDQGLNPVARWHRDPRPSRVLAYKIANIEDNTFPAVSFREPDPKITMLIEQPFSRHLLLGINTFALEMFKQFRKPLGLYAQDPYLPGKFAPILSGQDTAISESVDEAAHKPLRCRSSPQPGAAAL